MNDIKSYRDIIDKCSHCAFCEAVCPVFQEDLLETHVARSRMLIIRESLIEKNIPVSSRVREIINRCLLCGQCRHACPAGVPVDDIVIASRAVVNPGRPAFLLKRRLMNKMMAHRGEVPLLRLSEKIADLSGVALREFPKFTKKAFSKIYPSGLYEPKHPKRATVAYFVGCATNAFYPETGDAVMRVLSHNGIAVVIPEDLVCCGIPALASGDISSGMEMMRRNIEQLSQVAAEVIVTDCPSCLMALKEKLLFMIDPTDPLRQKAEGLSQKMTDVMAFLNRIGLVGPKPELKETYTCHIPCHARGDEGLANAPVALLSNVDQAVFTPLNEDSKCCGAGGAFFIDHKTLSRGLREKKCAAINGTGASTVLTPCPSCRTYIQSGLEEKTRVTHPMVFLAKAYGFPVENCV